MRMSAKILEYVHNMHYAIDTEMVVDLQYKSSLEQVTQRKVLPLSLAIYGIDWYVVGYCYLRRSVRMFRMDRIQSATMFRPLKAMELEVPTPTPKELMHGLITSYAWVLESMQTGMRVYDENKETLAFYQEEKEETQCGQESPQETERS